MSASDEIVQVVSAIVLLGSCSHCTPHPKDIWELSCCNPGGSWAGQCDRMSLIEAGRAQPACTEALRRQDKECISIAHREPDAAADTKLKRGCEEKGVRECGRPKEDQGVPTLSSHWCTLSNRMVLRRKFAMYYQMCAQVVRDGPEAIEDITTLARGYCEKKAAQMCRDGSTQQSGEQAKRVHFPWGFWCNQSSVQDNLLLLAQRLGADRFCRDNFGLSASRACLGTRPTGYCPFAESSSKPSFRARAKPRSKTVPIEKTAIVYVAQNGQHSSYAQQHWKTMLAERNDKGTLHALDQAAHLRNSLHSLYKYYNNKFHHPVLLFHTGDFDLRSQMRLAENRPGLRFVQLSGRFWRVPHAVNASAAAQQTWRGSDKYSVGYRLMIRWYGITMWEWLELHGFEYVMRMDDDSYLHSPINYNLFDFMETNGFVYGFRQMVVDSTFMFAELVQDYLVKRDVHPKTLLSFTTPENLSGMRSRFARTQRRQQRSHAIDLHGHAGWTGLGFYNNFLISKVGFWTQPEVRDFLQYIDVSGYIFTERLNDLQIQSVAVQTFAPASQQYWFEDFSYSHATTLTKSVPSRLLYGGLSLGYADPDPQATMAAYASKHFGQTTSWPEWPIFGTSECFDSDHEQIDVPADDGLSSKNTRLHGWLAKKLCADNGRLKELYSMRSLYCDPSFDNSNSEKRRQLLAFRGHPLGLAFSLPDLGLTYLPVPKAMSTTLRAMFVALQDISPGPPSPAWINAARKCNPRPPRAGVSTASRRITCAPGVRIVRPNDAQNLKQDGHFVFTVVRNPVTRFISALWQISGYSDEREPWLYSVASTFIFWTTLLPSSANRASTRAAFENSVRSGDSGGESKVFENFVRDVVQAKGEWDAHVLPQVHFLNSIPPQHLRVLRVEDSAEWAPGIISFLTARGAADSSIAAVQQALKPANAANVGASKGGESASTDEQARAEQLLGSLPAALRARWCEVYKPDFLRFGYELPRFCLQALGTHAPLPQVAGVSAVLETFNHRDNVPALAESFLGSPAISQIVVVDDGSVDGSGNRWEEALRSYPSGRVLRMSNVHEIRAYNAASREGGASRPHTGVVCFFQDDDIPHDGSAMQRFVSNALDAFNTFRHQRLALVSGRGSNMCGREIAPQEVDHALNASGPRVPSLRIPYADVKGRPFMFVTEGWLAPMCVRRDAFELAGGFNETLSKPGEPGIGLDIFLSLQLQLQFNMTVGLMDSQFDQGKGGHASTTTSEKVALRTAQRDRNARLCTALAGCAKGRWPEQLVSRAQELNARHLTRRAHFGSPDVLDQLERKCTTAVRVCQRPNAATGWRERLIIRRHG